MPVTTTEISKYSVSVFSEGASDGKIANVLLYDASGRVAAWCSFYSTAVTLPTNQFRADLGHPIVSYPAATLQSVVDILRNEKPLYFTWYDYSPRRFAAIGTGRESIGEAEAG